MARPLFVNRIKHLTGCGLLAALPCGMAPARKSTPEPGAEQVSTAVLRAGPSRTETARLSLREALTIVNLDEMGNTSERTYDIGFAYKNPSISRAFQYQSIRTQIAELQAPNIDIITARNTLHQARLNVNRTIFDYNQAQVNIVYAMGLASVDTLAGNTLTGSLS